MVTVPTLAVELATMTNVMFELNTAVIAGFPDTVMVVSAVEALSNVAVTVLTLFDPLSPMVSGVRISDTFGGDAPTAPVCAEAVLPLPWSSV